MKYAIVFGLCLFLAACAPNYYPTTYIDSISGEGIGTPQTICFGRAKYTTSAYYYVGSGLTGLGGVGIITGFVPANDGYVQSMTGNIYVSGLTRASTHMQRLRGHDGLSSYNLGSVTYDVGGTGTLVNYTEKYAPNVYAFDAGDTISVLGIYTDTTYTIDTGIACAEIVYTE